MIEVSLNEIDDPVFDLTQLAFQDGMFSLAGFVDLSEGRLLSGRRVVGTRENENRIGWIRHRLLFRAAGVESFEVDDKAGLGEIILDSIEARPGAIVLTGVIPCRIELRTAARAWSRLELGPSLEDRGFVRLQ
ncbi:hypothetical protein ACYX8G_16085 [Microbacterium saperdae]